MNPAATVFKAENSSTSPAEKEAWSNLCVVASTVATSFGAVPLETMGQLAELMQQQRDAEGDHDQLAHDPGRRSCLLDQLMDMACDLGGQPGAEDRVIRPPDPALESLVNGAGGACDP
jgi:hypothetical protein